MISSLDELRAIKRIMAEVQNELSKAGVAVADQVAIGLLVEVPATLQVLAALAEQVDFLAIDGDDLFQYGFAVDRQCGEVTHLHNSLEPALVRMLDQAVRVGHAAGIDVGLLGEMAGQPQYAPLLIGLSLDWLSMPAQFIGGVKEMVRQSLAAGCEQLGASLLSQDSLADGQDVLQEYLASQYRKYRTKKITKGYGRT
jgi:phosphoenolpyruvate-protein kinase (PTS system EI component)